MGVITQIQNIAMIVDNRYGVYLLKEEGTNWFKIGMTSEEPFGGPNNKRIQNIQCGNPRRLECVLWILTKTRPCAKQLEDVLHFKFDNATWRSKGDSKEWFRLSSYDLNLLGTVVALQIANKQGVAITVTEEGLELYNKVQFLLAPSENCCGLPDSVVFKTTIEDYLSLSETLKEEYVPDLA